MVEFCSTNVRLLLWQQHGTSRTRRTLLRAMLVGIALAPLASLSQQQPKVWRIGFLAPRSRPASLEFGFYGAFTQGMRELGYIEGKNLVIEWRFAEGKYELLPGLAA